MGRLLLLLTLGLALTAAEPAEALPGQIELHGTLRAIGGEAGRFWARLLAPDKAYGGHRMLQLVYEPPRPDSLAGTILVDCPYVLLDRQLNLVAWNGRQGLSQITPRGDGYHVVREVTEGEGVAAQAVGRESDLPGPRAWDLRLAPLLVAMQWRAEGAVSRGCVDFFGPLPPATVSWQGTAVSLAGSPCTVEPGRDGRLRRLLDAHGAVLIAVEDAATP